MKYNLLHLTHFDRFKAKAILLIKLHHYGIRGFVLEWIGSYLDDREQNVQMGDIIFNNRNIDCDIKQGSMLYHKLFILYISDVCNISRIPTFTLSTDDTNIFYSNIAIDIPYKQINNELNMLHVWFNVNKLSLSISKTNYMMFSNSKSTQTFNISINCVNIRRVCAVKYLRVYIDDKLNWKKHITYICNKLSIFYLYYTMLVKL